MVKLAIQVTHVRTEIEFGGEGVYVELGVAKGRGGEEEGGGAEEEL